MATIPLKRVTLLPEVKTTGSDDRLDELRQRRSKELVIAFAGPIGCGIPAVITAATSVLKELGYQPVPIKLSAFIDKQVNNGVITPDTGPYETAGANRYFKLQEGGNLLRQRFGPQTLAEHAVETIATYRADKNPGVDQIRDIVPEKTVYLVDQLKHPAEVELLRAVYRNLFFLIGTTSHIETRKRRLTEAGVQREEAESLAERDRQQGDKNGQQLEKTMKLADFFVRMDPLGDGSYEAELRRFFALMHNLAPLSPTKHEYAMYVAYAAAARSACLSRQVGAAILAPTGTVITTGRNDVPKAGGGLYEPSGPPGDDHRCFIEGKFCRNKRRKLELKARMKQKLADLKDSLPSLEAASEADLSTLLDEVYSSSGIEDLIEFSRSVHAEMDAIIEAARAGTSIQSATLYTTTFPCHSCARHIVAAGIAEVYYIEPYPKSLAHDLHGDSITFDNVTEAEPDSRTARVQFRHFAGVAPRQYLAFFQAKGERKDENGNLFMEADDGLRVLPEYLDTYMEFEARVVKTFRKNNVLHPESETPEANS